MVDNWAFVLGAYGLAAVLFAGYWRHLLRREREVTALRHARPGGPAAEPAGARATGHAPAGGGRP